MSACPPLETSVPPEACPHETCPGLITAGTVFLEAGAAVGTWVQGHRPWGKAQGTGCVPDLSEEDVTHKPCLAGICEVPCRARADPVRPRHQGEISGPGRANHKVITASIPANLLIHGPGPRSPASLPPTGRASQEL